MNFDFNKIKTVQFGIGRNNGDEEIFHCVMVDDSVQKALCEMVIKTWECMQQKSRNPVRYEPSEKYDSYEHIYIPLSDDLAIKIRYLHKAVNLDIDQKAIEDAAAIFCYFAKFTDHQEQNITALKQSIQFKGILKSHLLTFVNDSLKIIDDKVFKLDNDFDLLVDDHNIHVFRPKGFETIGKLKQVILGASEKNIKKLQESLSFVDFGCIHQYACKHSRATKYLASICSRQDIDRIDKQLLIEVCNKTGVKINNEGEMLVINEGNIMDFLEVLDRRRYELQLVPDESEQYRAPSRTRIRKEPT